MKLPRVKYVSDKAVYNVNSNFRKSTLKKDIRNLKGTKKRITDISEIDLDKLGKDNLICICDDFILIYNIYV